MFLKLFLSITFSILSLSLCASPFTLTPQEQAQISEEAENWIDDMPAGMQDRLSDAINHAMHGFYNEIELFRNLADTTGIGKYNVVVDTIKGGKYSDIAMRIYSAPQNAEKIMPALIYFHGGGWSLGSLNSVDKFCRALASEGGVKVVSVEYPLAPENPYPAGAKQCREAVEYLAEKAASLKLDANRLSLGGDGAGGNLALEVFSNLPNPQLIKSLVLYYPLLKTSGELNAENKREFGRGYGFDSRLWEAFIQAYKCDSALSFSNLPPTLLISAGQDIIIDDEETLSSQHPEIRYIQFSEALHGFITDGHQPSAFRQAVALTSSFLTQN